MTIDLAKAYRDVEAMLAEFGRQGDSYLVRVDVWNHRHGGASVEVDCSIVPPAGGCIAVHGATFDEVLTILRVRLTPPATQLSPGAEIAVTTPEPEPVSVPATPDDIPY